MVSSIHASDCSKKSFVPKKANSLKSQNENKKYVLIKGNNNYSNTNVISEMNISFLVEFAQLANNDIDATNVKPQTVM